MAVQPLEHLTSGPRLLAVLTSSWGLSQNLSLNSLGAAGRSFRPTHLEGGGVLFLDAVVRALLAAQGVKCMPCCDRPDPITTVPVAWRYTKPSAEIVARAIFRRLEKGEEDIFPTRCPRQCVYGWRAAWSEFGTVPAMASYAA